MIKNLESIDPVAFGFMMPIGVSKNEHRVYYSYPYIYIQNKKGLVYKFEDEDFSLDFSDQYTVKIEEWIRAIHRSGDSRF